MSCSLSSSTSSPVQVAQSQENSPPACLALPLPPPALLFRLHRVKKTTHLQPVLLSLCLHQLSCSGCTESRKLLTSSLSCSPSASTSSPNKVAQSTEKCAVTVKKTSPIDFFLPVFLQPGYVLSNLKLL
jgi:hypothetical protein